MSKFPTETEPDEPEHDDEPEHGDEPEDESDGRSTDHPEAGTFGAADTDNAGNPVVIRMSPVNPAMIKAWTNKLAMRELCHGAFSFAELLQAQLDRSTKVKGRPGLWTADAFSEAKRPLQLGIQGALEVRHNSILPSIVKQNAGPLSGLSVFAMPKLIRYITRSGIKGVKIQDITNSHYRMVYIVAEQHGLLRLVPALFRVVTGRDAVFQHIAESYQCMQLSRDEIKTLLLKILFGGNYLSSVNGAQNDFLNALSLEVCALAKAVGKIFPAIVSQMVVWGKSNPEVSCLSYVAANMQRQKVDGMKANVPEDFLCSEERDGFVHFDPENQHRVESDVPFTTESYPDAEQILNMAKEKYPSMDFSAQSEVSMRDYVASRRCCLESLESGYTGNTTDFGNVIAFRLEPRVFINDNDTMEYYEDSEQHHGRWKVTKKEKAMKRLVRSALLDEFRPLKASYSSDGKLLWKREGNPHPLVKTSRIRNAITEDVSLVLKRDPSIALDCSERIRRLLVDCNGLVYDFNSGQLFPNTPSLRLQRNLPFSFEQPWKIDPGLQKKLDELLDKIFAYWLSGDGPKNKSLYADPVGQSLAAAFMELVKDNPEFQYWNVMLPIVVNDVDELFWDALHFAADACSWQKRCEFRYKYGEGGSGKDVGHCIALNFFGTRDKNGLAGIIPNAFFTSKYQVSPDSPSTTLEQMRGMRYLANNEVPKHDFINMDAIKAICEQEGVPMISRGLYADPVPWRPMAGVSMGGNHPLALTDAQMGDSGNRRRLCYLRMRAALADSGKDVKKIINAGKLNSELFWIARKFFEYLQRMPHSTRLHPIPPRVQAETKELLDQKKAIEVKAWIEEHTGPAEKIAAGTLAATIRGVLARSFKVEKQAVSALLVAAGAKPKKTGDGHFLIYMYPDCTKYQAIKVKPEVLAAATAKDDDDGDDKDDA